MQDFPGEKVEACPLTPLASVPPESRRGGRAMAPAAQKVSARLNRSAADRTIVTPKH